MLPEELTCEDCGRTSAVRGYGRIEYGWPQDDRSVETLELTMIRLTIDCPHCGIRVQDFYPAGRPERMPSLTRRVSIPAGWRGRRQPGHGVR